MKNELTEIFKKRYSCRKFTEEQISEQDLKCIIEAGNAAPIAMNCVDDYKIIVVQDKTLLEELELCGQQLFSKMNLKRSVIYKAPTLIIIASKKAEGAFRQAQICSASCILENMTLKATELELGSCFLTGIITAINLNKQLLHKLTITDDYEATAALIVGKTELKQPSRDLSQVKFEVTRL